MSIHHLTFTPKQLHIITYLINEEIEYLNQVEYQIQDSEKHVEEIQYIKDRLVHCKQIYSQLQKKL